MLMQNDLLAHTEFPFQSVLQKGTVPINNNVNVRNTKDTKMNMHILFNLILDLSPNSSVKSIDLSVY